MTDSSEMSVLPESSDSPEERERRKRPRWLAAVVAAGLVAVLAAAGLVGGRVLGVWGDDEPAASPAPSPTPTERADPFAGTPAEDFAEGADGIVLPEAEPIGDFTADEVAEALELVRDALIAARLDPAVLIDHDLEPLLAVMAADRQPGMKAAIEANALGPFPTLVAPNVALAPVPSRVAGTFSYRLATSGVRDTPIVRVETRFAWVYPFKDGLVVVRDELSWEVRMGRPWIESSRGLWLAEAASAAWGVECDAYQNGMLRPYQAVSGPSLLGSAIFDPEEPLDAVPSC